MEQQSSGAQWLKVDLHLHTPYSESFNLPDGFNLGSVESRRRFTVDYVARLRSQEIQLASITDYNGISKAWYSMIRDEAQKQAITILPGVELAFQVGKYGLHVLVIFDGGQDLDGIDHLIHSMDKNPQEPLSFERKHRVIVPKQDIVASLQAIKESCDSRCLIIFAHPEDEGGLCKSLDAKQRAELLKLADGIETISAVEKKKILSTGKLAADFFEHISILENSDPKRLEEIGQKTRGKLPRATFVKLGAQNLESLHFALHDPQVRVRLYEKPELRFDCVRRLSIKGSAFLKNVDIELHPELTTLIGGRGVGKSALLESLRYTLELPIYSEKSERADFVRDVVGSGGEIAVLVERYYGEQKKRFTVKRTIGKDGEVFDESGKRTDLSVKDIFDQGAYPILIGQKELYHVSTSQSFLRHLIDQIIGEGILRQERQLKRETTLLEQNGRRFAELEQKTGQKDEYEQRLKNTNAEIKLLRDLKVEEKLRRWTAIIEDDQRIQEALTTFEQWEQESMDFFDRWESQLSSLCDTLRQGKSEHKQVVGELAEHIETLKSGIGKAREDISSNTKMARQTLDILLQRWGEGKTQVEKDIQAAKRELGEKGLDPERLGALIRQKAQLESLFKKTSTLSKELKTIRNEREQFKKRLGEERLQLFRLRQERLERINTVLEGILNVRVSYEEEVETFAEELRNLLKGSNVSSDAVTSVVHAPQKTVDGLLLSRYIQAGEDRVREEFGLTPTMAGRLCRWFLDTQRLHRLEVLFPEDKIEIELNVDGKPRPMSKLSVGQKATALLLLLFAQEKRLLILDQPEEDLDNRFIYEDVVKVLRKMKGKRQLIIATHNANIPVLGDAEYILALEPRKESCSVAAAGSVETMKAEVKSIMEGGEEAFRLRAEKYGGG